MKKAINVLIVILLTFNLVFSQSAAQPKPVKKVVTSKITKDPKTGKVVKTITTITTTDIVLVPGRESTKLKSTPSTAKVTSQSKQPVAKKTVVISNIAVAAKKPVIKPKAVVTKPKPAPEKTVIVAKEENNSIFANPTDDSSKNLEKVVKVEEERSELNTAFVAKPSTTSVINSNTSKKPIGTVLKEKVKTGNTFFGMRGGANLSSVENVKSLSGLLSATINKNIGINTGIFFNFGLSKMISIQPEFNYSQQGYDLTNGIESETLNNQAINIPVLFKLAVGGSKVKFFVNGGPYAGLLLKSEKISVSASQTITNLVDFTNQDGKEIKVNRYDYGVQAGTGFQFDLGGPKLEIEGRYNYGLADPMIYTNSKPSYMGQTGRNRMITGTIGLLFPIGR